MTPEARAALHRIGWSRRDFLKTSGALVVTFSSVPAVEAQNPFGTRLSHVDPAQLDSWIAVAADGRITAFTGKAELGQGMLTAQTQLVAEELSVPIDHLTLVQCDTSVCPDQGTTSGSQSSPTNFNHRGLAQAAATAREALLRLASTRLRVPVDRLVAAGGVIRGGVGMRVTYGELVRGRKLNLPLDPAARRKPAGEWTVLGTPVPRLDMAAMVTGTFEFVHNVHVPGMRHGAVVRPPSIGATLVGADEASIRQLPGGVRLVVRHNFVGVVADKPWQALQAAAALKTTWKNGPALPAQTDFYEWLRRQPSRDGYVVDSGDVDDTMKRATSVVRATYRHPYQMHASMGTSCAVADVRGDTATIWSPTQSAYPTRNSTATLLGLPAENVRVIFTRGAGCYGLNGADTVTFDAALLSQAVGQPVRVQLTRRDEMAWENYGSPYVIDQRAGLAADGTILTWDYEAWSAAPFTRADSSSRSTAARSRIRMASAIRSRAARCRD